VKRTAVLATSRAYCWNTKPIRQFTSALKLLMDYEWPQRSRTRNVVERAVVLSTQERVDVDLFRSIRSKRSLRCPPSAFEFFRRCRQAGARSFRRYLSPRSSDHGRIERRIMDMLERTGWNQTEAAERFLIPFPR